jgi:hypothetical protein
MIKISKLQLILIVAVAITILYFVSNSRFEKPDTKSDLVSFFKANKAGFLNLEETFARAGLSDSNFYAEHRFREDKFHFFRLEGSEQDTPFQLELAKYDLFKTAVLALNIKNIWKYPDENFYTLAIRGMEKFDNKKLFVLVLKSKVYQFLPSLNSSINVQDTTSSLLKFGNDKSIFVINSRLWIDLKND